MTRDSDPFTEYAAEYDRWFDSAEGRDIFSREVECLRNVMPSTKGRWVEIGVGTGRFAEALGVQEGIDPSAVMLGLARGRGIETVEGTGEQLPFADDCFDGVLLVVTLCFLDDPKTAFCEIHRILKDTGRLILGMIPSESPWGELYARKASQGHPIYAAANFHSCDEVLDLADTTGFTFIKACSCLLTAPEADIKADRSTPKIVKNAGFVAMAFTS